MMLKGKIGDTTYYVAESRQLARQALNNSNYGATASRTDVQQTRRVRWANLVNFYSGNKAWMKKAYENLKPGVSVFNRFMQLNIASADVALTKSEAQAKLWVPASYRVSQGSLPSIEGTFFEGMPGFTINGGVQIVADTTVAAFSQALIEGNAQFANGDAIVCVAFRGVTGEPNSTTGMNPVKYVYSELVLDTQSSETMAEKYPDWFMDNIRLGNALGDGYQAGVFIHTRKSAGKLYVSTQDIFLNADANTNAEAWRTNAQVQKAIASYGESTSVPLAPGGAVNSGSGNDSSSGGMGDGSGSLE